VPGEAPRMTLQTLRILNVMLDDPAAHWYGLEVARRADLKTGTIYPALARLERAGWLESRWERVNPSEEGRPRRRLYTLTGQGERAARQAISENASYLAPRARPHARKRRGNASTADPEPA
jgi:PadR family transcriptional regulator PadR